MLPEGSTSSFISGVDRYDIMLFTELPRQTPGLSRCVAWLPTRQAAHVKCDLHVNHYQFLACTHQSLAN